MSEESSNSQKPQVTPSSDRLDALRNEARGALMAKKRAEARVSLGRLVAMSEDEDDKRNLEVLVGAVNEEVAQYTRWAGAITARLHEGQPLADLQAGLDKAIPHWRAFTNDLPELALARDGLSAHEDPETKRKLKELEKKLAEGAVHEVLDSWIELGQPEAAASGVFVQVLNAFTDLGVSLERRDWKGAKERVAETKQLLETEDAMPFRSGCLPQVDSLEDKLRWELLLIKCASSSELAGRERNRLLVELSRADNDIDFRQRDNPALDEIHSRIKVAIEDLSVVSPQEVKEKSLVKPLIVVLVLIVLALIALWIYFGASNPSDSTGIYDKQHVGSSLSLLRNPALISIPHTQ